MSAYKVVQCEIKSESHIIAGLIDMGFSRDMIEVHKSAVPLADYTGRLGNKKGNIVVRRKHFKTKTRARYNADLGFEKTKDGYRTHINSEESGWWSKQEPRFKQIAAAMQVTEKAKKRGYHVKRVEQGDKIRLQLSKNF